SPRATSSCVWPGPASTSLIVISPRTFGPGPGTPFRIRLSASSRARSMSSLIVAPPLHARPHRPPPNLAFPQLGSPVDTLQLALQLQPVPRRHQCLRDMVESWRLPILARFVQAGQEPLVHGVDPGGEVGHGMGTAWRTSPRPFSAMYAGAPAAATAASGTPYTGWSPPTSAPSCNAAATSGCSATHAAT